MDWVELLDPRHGGPGGSPGRPELIQQLQDERTGDKPLTSGKGRRKKGRSTRKTT